MSVILGVPMHGRWPKQPTYQGRNDSLKNGRNDPGEKTEGRSDPDSVPVNSIRLTCGFPKQTQIWVHKNEEFMIKESFKAFLVNLYGEITMDI